MELSHLFSLKKRESPEPLFERLNRILQMSHMEEEIKDGLRKILEDASQDPIHFDRFKNRLIDSLLPYIDGNPKDEKERILHALSVSHKTTAPNLDGLNMPERGLVMLLLEIKKEASIRSK